MLSSDSPPSTSTSPSSSRRIHPNRCVPVALGRQKCNILIETDHLRPAHGPSRVNSLCRLIHPRIQSQHS